VERATKRRILELLTPFVQGIGSVLKLVYDVVFAWWLDPWLQRKENRALWDAVQANLYFITSESHADLSGPTTLHPFDYASIEVPWKNLVVTITRGRGDVTVSVAPRHAPEENYELGPLVAALEERHFSERDVVNDLAGAANLLKPRLQQLNTAFSEREFPKTKQLLRYAPYRKTSTPDTSR
jgi:hypothetical protein